MCTPCTLSYLDGTDIETRGIYEADFHPQDLPVDDVTHILYSFANITEDGEV